MFWDKFVTLCNSKNIKPYPTTVEMGFASSAANKWKKGATPSDANLKKIADYFGVSIQYFDENESVSKISEKPTKATEDDIKVALFGGDEEVTDEMWEEVKRFAEFVKLNKGKK